MRRCHNVKNDLIKNPQKSLFQNRTENYTMQIITLESFLKPDLTLLGLTQPTPN